MPQVPARFRRSVVTNYLYTACTAVVALVMTPVLVHGLGKEAYGIWVLAGSLALYLELLEFGFGQATIKYVADASAFGDRDRVLRTIATSFWVLAIPGLIALGVGVVAAFAFPAIFDVSPGLAAAATVVVLLVTFDLAVSIPSDTFGGTLVGLQRFDLLNATLVAVLAAQAISWAIVLAAGGGLVEIAVVTVVLGLVGQLARYLITRRLLAGLSLARHLFDRSLVRPLASLSAWLALAQTSLIATTRLDTIIVGLVIGIRGAAVYAVGQKLAFAAERFVTPAVKMFFPWSAELAARRDEASLRASLTTGTRLSLAVAGPLALALIVVAGPAIDAWVGEGFEEAGTVVALLAAATIMSAFGRTSLLMLQGSGRARPPAVISLIEAGLNLALSVVLAVVMGLEGVALATLIAAAFAHPLLLVPYATREFGVSLSSLLRSVATAHALPAAGALAIGLMIARAGVDGPVPVLSAAAAIVLSYLVIFAGTGLERDERAFLVARSRLLVRRSSP